jgi:hypothetical protein
LRETKNSGKEVFSQVFTGVYFLRHAEKFHLLLPPFHSALPGWNTDSPVTVNVGSQAGNLNPLGFFY